LGDIEDSLKPGETVLYRASISRSAIIFPMIIFVILIGVATAIYPFLGLFVGAAIIYFVIHFILVVRSTVLALTNLRIIARKGISRRNHRSLEILLPKIESITFSQSVDGRIFGFGTVTVTGSEEIQEFFPLISKPWELKKRVNDQLALVTRHKTV
jgi:uncharacterized membrane protein YdbT with pleckstrin-like domain